MRQELQISAAAPREPRQQIICGLPPEGRGVANMADKEQSTETLTAASQPNNPLSRKLNKLLDTRLDNDKVYTISDS